MGKPESPTPLDPSKLIADQTKANKDLAGYTFGLNAVNQSNPMGSQTFTKVAGVNGAPDSWTSNTTLSGDQQRLFDANTAGRQNVADKARAASAGLELDPLNTPTYGSYGAAPPMSTAGGTMGPLTTGVNGGQVRDSIANAGPVNGTVANAGPINKSLSTNDYSAERSRVENALFARLNPQIERDRSGLENRLAQQGIRLGSSAYDRAMEDHGRNVNDARLGTILNAGTEQGRMQQLDLNARTFGNNAQAQQYGQNANDTTIGLGAQAQRYGQNANDATFANSAQAQRFGQGTANADLNNSAQAQTFAQSRTNIQDANSAGQRNFENANTTTGLNNANRSADFANRVTANGQSINEIMSLLGGSQINVPSFGAPPQTGVAGVDGAGITSNAYNQQQQQYQQQMNQWNSTMGGLFGLGSNALLAFSDERLKTDKKRIGTTPGGLGIFSYKMKTTGDREIGVMAQEAERKQPGTVQMHPSGYRQVDYARIQ